MRWLLAVAVVSFAVLIWTVRPVMSPPQTNSGLRFPANEPRVEPSIDLAAAIRQFKKTLTSGKFNSLSCAPVLDETYRKVYLLHPNQIDGTKLKAAGTEISALLFEVKIALRTRLKSHEFSKNEACVRAIRNILRAARVLEDFVGEVALDFPDFDSEDLVPVLSGESPTLMLNPAFANLEFKSGDVFLSRGSAFVSAAIARLTDVDSNLSHAEILYIDPESGKRSMIGAHIELGTITQPFEKYVSDGKVRAAVFRHPDANLAHRAAEVIFKRVKKHRDEHGENVPYDFAMNMSDDRELFCSELIKYAFESASSGALKMPAFSSLIQVKNRDFIDRIGIKPGRTFVPADLELDTRFDLVAEWRDFSRVNMSHMHDAILTSIYEWMESDGYVLKETSLIGIKKVVAWHLRRWPVFSALLRDKLPTNMSQEIIGAMTALNETSEALYAELDEVNEAVKERTGYWMTPAEMKSELERYRREDLRSYQNYQKTQGYDPLVRKPDFHLLFRPK